METASHAQEAMEIVGGGGISAAILDVMMPGTDGFALCKEIRLQHYFPVLFLTARAGEQDKLEGLACGGDDYMVKPFSAGELLARIGSLIRRSTQYNLKQPVPVAGNLDEEQSVLQIANLEYNQHTGVICVHGHLLDLTDLEYRILVLLLKEKGTAYNTERIYRQIWGEAFTVSSNNNVIVHIKNLRRKLYALDSQVEYIHTIWGKGYAVYV